MLQIKNITARFVIEASITQNLQDGKFCFRLLKTGFHLIKSVRFRGRFLLISFTNDHFAPISIPDFLSLPTVKM